MAVAFFTFARSPPLVTVAMVASPPAFMGAGRGFSGAPAAGPDSNEETLWPGKGKTENY